ncbi:MAG: hypothetical protein N2109_06425 [Fimbriimonadales bacterium]|nr:hypothetical protein [Fimbriimonadales bacterium]
MSRRPPSGDGLRAEETFFQFLEAVARFVFWGGLLASLVSIGLLVYTFVLFAAPNGADPDRAAANVEILRKVLAAGALSVGVGSAYLFWGEEVLGALLLIGAALLYFAPLVVPLLVGDSGVAAVVARASLGAVQNGGVFLGLVAVAVIVLDVAQRMRLRAMYGAKADALRYGRNVGKEVDFQNVFLGKCWQLPYCRKFVRERCPIYHAQTTCWRERVGCMCEEDVIRGAMEGRPVPKSQEEAFRLIPYNQKLSAEAKAERCRACVIYNERQKHKYRLAVPMLFVSYGALVALFHRPMLGGVEGLIRQLDRVIGIATYREGQRLLTEQVPFVVQALLLACLLVVALAYSLKLVEFLIFKAKL